jgi:hypothetical protein
MWLSRIFPIIRYTRVCLLLMAGVVCLELIAQASASSSPRQSAANSASTTPNIQKPCKLHPAVIAPCFMIHGRLSYWNGTPSARIWKIGTKRILGVSDGLALPEYEQMPENVEILLGGLGTNVYGDFEFCPFTNSEPGVMQLGCIQSGKNLRVTHGR